MGDGKAEESLDRELSELLSNQEEFDDSQFDVIDLRDSKSKKKGSRDGRNNGYRLAA